MAKNGNPPEGFGLLEWHDTRIDGLTSSEEEAAAAFIQTMKENAAKATAQRADLFDVPDAGEVAGEQHLNLQSDLLSLESDLNTLDSGVFDFTSSGSFKFEAPDGSVIEPSSDLYDVMGTAQKEGGLTDALNRFARAESTHGERPPQPPVTARQTESDRPAQMTPMIARPAAARPDSAHSPRAAAPTPTEPETPSETRQPPSCRYAAVSAAKPERVRARKVAVKVRMG